MRIGTYGTWAAGGAVLLLALSACANEAEEAEDTAGVDAAPPMIELEEVDTEEIVEIDESAAPTASESAADEADDD